MTKRTKNGYGKARGEISELEALSGGRTLQLLPVPCKLRIWPTNLTA
jgi:hypothetical protein